MVWIETFYYVWTVISEKIQNHIFQVKLAQRKSRKLINNVTDEEAIIFIYEMLPLVYVQSDFEFDVYVKVIMIYLSCILILGGTGILIFLFYWWLLWEVSQIFTSQLFHAKRHRLKGAGLNKENTIFCSTPYNWNHRIFIIMGYYRFYHLFQKYIQALSTRIRVDITFFSTNTT